MITDEQRQNLICDIRYAMTEYRWFLENNPLVDSKVRGVERQRLAVEAVNAVFGEVGDES